MADKIVCPGCKASLQIREGLAGKRVKCPKCGNSILIPSPPEEEEFVDVDPLDEEEDVETVEEAPRKKGKARRVEEEDEEEDEVEEKRPARKKKGRRGKDGGQAEWEPCPSCGAERAKRVLWTFWGSFYGPAMFSHVECRECGTRYNGRTGGSNLIPAIILFTLPLLLILGLIAFILYILHAREII
jgi:predicted Zn finger-like uncharacterized protein